MEGLGGERDLPAGRRAKEKGSGDRSHLMVGEGRLKALFIGLNTL